ncbi:L-lactate dehydrogenase [Thozetella sp. PMI_491]|nr:L-lactate dehydrogenase [Thozetella sp. PMI_491]
MASRIITAEELSQHASPDDGWIALNGVVWDISGFPALHPGGPGIIVESLGRDASSVYNRVHGPGLVSSPLGNAKQVGRFENGPPSNKDSGVSKKLPPLTSIVNLHDFAEAASKSFSKAAWAQISGATEDCITRDLNGDFYRRILFRPRILRDITDCDISREVFGTKFDVPFFNSPFSIAKLSHSDGELVLARGLAAKGSTMIIPTLSSFGIDEIVAALPPGQPFFFQLYMYNDRSISERMLRYVTKLGAKAIMLTVDLPVMSKREGRERHENTVLQAKAAAKAAAKAKAKDMARGSDRMMASNLEWKDVQWIKEVTGLPVLAKGIQSAADAKLALDHGCGGIYISNHGGRALDTAAPSILTLMEIQADCPEVLEKMEVFVDGGVRRGTDVLKAICLGASAVCLGRPFFYAAAYGDEGVEHAIEILKDELRTAMQLAGITSLDQAHPGLLNTTAVDHCVTRGDAHPWAKKIVRGRL